MVVEIGYVDMVLWSNGNRGGHVKTTLRRICPVDVIWNHPTKGAVGIEGLNAVIVRITHNEATIRKQRHCGRIGKLFWLRPIFSGRAKLSDQIALRAEYLDTLVVEISYIDATIGIDCGAGRRVELSRSCARRTDR